MLGTMIGGIFSGIGTVRAQGGGLLNGDRWDELNNPILPFNDADEPGDASDWCWFAGTFVRAGAFTIGGDNFGLARWDFANSEWIGMGPINSGEVICLFVFKGFCYIAWGPGPTERVQRIDPSDWSIDNFGWNTEASSNSTVRVMLDFDLDGAINLVFGGDGMTGGNAYLRLYDGSSFTDIGGPTTVGGNVIRALARHDFTADLDGEDMLCIGGQFTTIGATSGYGHVAQYKASTATWSKIGAAGINMVGTTGGQVSALASYNKRLWATRENPSSVRSALTAISNSGGDWAEADTVVKNLDVSSGGSLWRYSGSPGSPVAASGLTLDVYAGRLHVGGWFQFRGARRGATATGAITYWNGRVSNGVNNNGTIFRALPYVKGSVSALCIYDGQLIFGGDCRVTLPDGSTLRHLGGWTDPGDPELDGTFDTLGGGVNGPVYAACVFDSKLFVCGDFTVAGTGAGAVMAKGIAYWNGSAWASVVNIRDYGIPRVMVVFGSELIVAGDFAKVDGSATYKLAVRLTTTFTKGALFDDLTGPQGNGIIRALFVNGAGDRLYMGGEFDELDQLGAFGVMNPSNVAYTTGVASTWAWNTLDDATLEGISGGTVHSIGEKEVSGVDWIFVGCDPSAKGGDVTTADPLWRWDPTSDNWVNAESALVGVNEPIMSMANTSDQQTINFSHYGTAGGTGGNQYRVRDHTVSASNIWIGEGTFGQAYSAQPRAMLWGDAGDGVKLYIGNERGSLGGLEVESSSPAVLIIAINQDDQVVDVAGGCGQAEYFDFAVQDQFVKQLRSDVTSDTRDEVQTAAVGGAPDGTGKLLLEIFNYKGHWIETAEIDDDPTFATVITNINTALDAALGVDRVVASGTDWDAIEFTYSGLDYTRHNRPMLRFHIDRCKIVIEGPPTADDFTITIKRTGFADAETAPIDYHDNFRTVIDNINAALAAATGGYATVEGDDWENIYLIHADVNHAAPTVDITNLAGATSVTVETTRLTGATSVSVTRTTRVEDQRLLVAGTFRTTSRGYSQWVLGIDIAGRMVPVGEGLGGVRPGSTHLQRFPADIKCIPRSRWPDEWTTDDDSDLKPACQPHYKWVWLLAGNFSEAINGSRVRSDDTHISDVVSLAGLAIYDGVRYYRDVGIKTNPQALPETAECYDDGGGAVLVSGGGGALEYYDYMSDTWEYFIEPGTSGSMLNDSVIRKLVVFGDDLLGGGQMSFNGDAAFYAMMKWNGTEFTKIHPTGFTGDSTYIRDIVVGDIGGGVKAYAGGFPDTDACPVIVSSDGTTWSAVGGASQLRGECYSLAVIETGPTPILFATGALSIDVGSGFEDVQSAWWNGTAWAIGPYFNNLAGPSEKAAVGDFHGRQTCERQFARVIFGGDMNQLFEDPGDIDTTDAKWAGGICQFKEPTHGDPAALDLGGCNGRITAAASAGAELWA